MVRIQVLTDLLGGGSRNLYSLNGSAQTLCKIVDERLVWTRMALFIGSQ